MYIRRTFIFICVLKIRSTQPFFFSLKDNERDANLFERRTAAHGSFLLLPTREAVDFFF